MAKGWYVLHVYSGYEKRVEEAINNMIQEKVLEGILFQIRVPVKDVTDIKNGKKRVQKKKVFPGYVLLEMDIDKHRWREIYTKIKSINGVTGFVGADRFKAPFPLNPEEVKVMLQTSGDSKSDIMIKQKYDFKNGETVKIIDGPFNTFSGVIEAVDKEKGKLKVMVGIFGRSTPVELDFAQVEKI